MRAIRCDVRVLFRFGTTFRRSRTQCLGRDAPRADVVGMATTARKTKKRKKTRTSVTASKKNAQFKVQDGQLVVHLSRDEHPEVFDTDKLLKAMRRVVKTHGDDPKCQDLVEFLNETERSLEILLRNHLEDAMRKYLK